MNTIPHDPPPPEGDDDDYQCNLLDPRRPDSFGAAWFLPKNTPISISFVHEKPSILSIENFLSPAEARELIRRAEPHMQASTLVHEGREVVSTYRTSKTGTFYNRDTREDPLLYSIRCRASTFSHYPISHIEDLKIVKYEPGEYYKVHHDSFHVINDHVRQAGNRIMTFFVYLTDHDTEAGEGGATHFPRLGVRVPPRVGRAAMWLNLDANGERIMDMEHEGEPVHGTRPKWGLNIWIRTKAQYS